jgi:hypothetical protein
MEHRVVWMMPREQANALLQDYCDHVYPLLPVIHGPTTRTLVAELYTQLSCGEQIRPQVAALVLCISAIGAYFWQPGAENHSRFASAESAAKASAAWRQLAFDILRNSRGSNCVTLEEVQAWTLLTFISYSVDGCSYRFRFLHNCTLTNARELLLHLVDSPRAERDEGSVSRELKRRLWWHIAATDW